MPDRPIVFVVDDDAGIRQWLKSLLEDADYSVRSFATGRAFIDAFRDTESGCLIADVRLPDMSGLELQSWLSARGAPVPVIIVTGYGDVTVAVQSMQGGAVDFIEKPASNITILDAVRRALARAAALRGDNSSATEAADAEARLRLLSPREREVVKAFVRGRTNDAIADALGIDLRAVELHRARAMEKLGATGPSHLLRLTLAGNIDVLELDVQPVTATDLDLLLQGFTHAARAAAAAELAAVAIFDDGPARADRFFVSGLALDNRALHQALSHTATLTALAAARRPRRLRRLAGDPQLIEFPPDFPAVHAVLLIPLATRKRAYGWLALLNKRAQDGFDDEDEQVGLGLANQVARTLELNAELQARIDQQRAIAHLSAMALVGGDLQGLFDQTVRLVAQTIGVAYCSILELNGTREEMTARAGVGWPNGIAGEATVPGGPGSLIGAALAATEPIVFLDLAAETRFQVGPILKRCGVVSGFTVNIPGMARPYGTLGAYTDKPRNFSADEIEFVRTLANVVGQAVARKQTEESLSRMQKMEAIGLLTGGIAHDFNNLLTVVLGNAQLAATMTEEGSELHAINAEIEAAARRGADLTHRLLAFSRRQPLRPATLDPARLVSGMRSLLARALDANVEIEVLADDAAGLVHADATQLESALLNLAINARDAMPTGGRLVIDVRNAEIGESFAAADPELKAGPYVVVSVSDTGTGMPPEVANRAFEPFFTTKAVGKGSGLGLSMVYGFARQSGGCVKLDSKTGHGTAVRIYLPRAETSEPVTTAPDRAIQSVPNGSETILVVEDDHQVRHYVVRQLRRLGYSVTYVSDGPAALDRLRSAAAIDLLFLDVIMPGGLNGFEVAVAARQLRPGLPVVMASGYPDAALSRHGDAPPGVDLLRKPYQVSELARALRSALESAPLPNSDHAGTA